MDGFKKKTGIKIGIVVAWCLCLVIFKKKSDMGRLLVWRFSKPYNFTTAKIFPYGLPLFKVLLIGKYLSDMRLLQLCVL